MPKLEGIITRATADSDSRNRIVEDEGVITTAAIHLDILNTTVVVHPFEESSCDRKQCIIHLVGSNHTATRRLIRAEEEEILIIVTVNAHTITAVIHAGTSISNVHCCSIQTCEADFKDITAISTINQECGSHTGEEGLITLTIVVHTDCIVTTLSIHCGIPTDGADVNHITRNLLTSAICSRLIATEDVSLTSVRAFHKELVNTI